ncbi:PCI domain-containing protein [Candidatus Bathyarchaeota archaeon]|nr:PCI domain-containing protein [Candidatus Bathyarchaeota archaeon]
MFAVVDTLIGYFQRVLMNTVKNVDETIIGTITSYSNKLTLSELAARFKLKEDELEKILSNINMQGEYSIRIDKDTGIVSAAPVVSLIGTGTKDEKLQRLEELFKEGKISERTYKSLKEKYSKEEK